MNRKIYIDGWMDKYNQKKTYECRQTRIQDISKNL